MKLDVAFCRAHFPALATDWALFENGGGSLPPRQVIDRVTHYMASHHVQLGASYELSVTATQAVDAGQAAMAELIGAHPSEVVVTSSTTMNVFLLSQALAARWQPGDEIVVTNLDHEANSGAWRRLAERGLVVKEWQFRPDTMALELEDLEPLLTERTRLVCFTHCSNVVGGFHDVAAIARRVHQAGAMVCVDGVAYAPHRRVDVKALDVDFYLVSLYKVYGPHLGLMYGKREHLLQARALNHFFIGNDEIPYKLQPGGVVHELTAALPGILEYLDAVYAHHAGAAHGAGAAQADVAGAAQAGMAGAAQADRATRLQHVFELFAQHEEILANRLLDFLRSRKGVRVLGPQTGDRQRRAPTVAFTVEGRHADELPEAVNRSRVAIRSGDFYAARPIAALGLAERGGVVRASMVHYNTLAEVDRLIAALEPLL